MKKETQYCAISSTILSCGKSIKKFAEVVTCEFAVMKYLAYIIVRSMMIQHGAEAADKVRMSISAIDVSFLTAGWH